MKSGENRFGPVADTGDPAKGRGLAGGLHASKAPAVFDLADWQPLTIFVGAYGSGKSEVSVNFALWLASQVPKGERHVVLVDLDTINPYYRSADARAILAAAGVRLIASIYANTNVDVPAVPAGVLSAFDDPDQITVLDIGGEDLGARVVASLRPHLAQRPYAIYMVVNPFRPTTDTVAGICQQVTALTSTIGLPLQGLVHNANLLNAGDASLLVETWPLVQQAAAAAGLPVVFAAAMADQIPAGLADQLPANLPLLLLQRTIQYPTAP